MTNGNDSIKPIFSQPLSYKLPDGTKRIDIGLTKREYFAAMAMQGLLSRQSSGSCTEFADVAVFAADKLIEQLNKQP